MESVNRDQQVPRDFDELADCLLGIGSHFSPAELHGALVGALAGAMRLSREQWAAFSLAVCGAEGDAARIDDYAVLFGGLAERELAQLAASELDFRLFLPDDDYEIEQRTECLASWCKGFLGGFAEARARCAAAPVENAGSELPEAVVESLRDMAAIAQASAEAGAGSNAESPGDEDDEFAMSDFDSDPLQADAQELADPEEAERDYMEVSEYLRLAALTVFTEYGWVEQHASSGSAESKTLH